MLDDFQLCAIRRSVYTMYRSKKLKNLNFRLSDLQDIVTEAEASITSENWAECCSHLEKIEAEYWRILNIQDELNPVVISFSDDSSSGYNSDDETDTASETGETTETADEI
jgi:hypothetical protein